MSSLKQCKKNSMQYQVIDNELVYCLLKEHECKYQGEHKDIHIKTIANKSHVKYERHYACNYTLEDKVS